MVDKITRLIKSPASFYVVLRYITYILQFLNSIILVKVLGDYSYGIYGFILMFSVYAVYLNIGLNESLNAEYSLNKKNQSYVSSLWNNTLSFSIIWYTLITVIALVILFLDSRIFSKYEFSSYGLLLILTCTIHNISTLFATLYKIHGKTFKVNIQQILPQLGILIIILCGPKIASIQSIVWVMFLTNILSLIICLSNPPQSFTFNLNYKILYVLIKRGFSLLLYNLSFQLLTMLAVAVVSYLYSVKQMGCYSLSNSITNGVIMAGGAFLYIFSPRLIYKMGESKETAKKLIEKFEKVYNVFIDFVSIISILLVLALSYAYPEYGTEFVKIYSILIVGRIINNAATGYSTYLIANKKESKLVVSGLISLFFSGIGYIVVAYNKLDITTIPMIIALASIVFSSLVIFNGQKELYGTIRIGQLMRFIIGQGKWVIILICTIYFLLWDHWITLIGGFCFYLIINSKNIINSARIGYRIVGDKQALKF